MLLYSFIFLRLLLDILGFLFPEGEAPLDHVQWIRVQSILQVNDRAADQLVSDCHEGAVVYSDLQLPLLGEPEVAEFIDAVNLRAQLKFLESVAVVLPLARFLTIDGDHWVRIGR